MIMVIRHKGAPKKKRYAANSHVSVDVSFGQMMKILNFRVIPLYESTHRA